MKLKGQAFPFWLTPIAFDQLHSNRILFVIDLKWKCCCTHKMHPIEVIFLQLYLLFWINRCAIDSEATKWCCWLAFDISLSIINPDSFSRIRRIRSCKMHQIVLLLRKNKQLTEVDKNIRDFSSILRCPNFSPFSNWPKHL